MDNIVKNLEKVEERLEETSLAMELLLTLKKVIARQYIVIIILASMLFASNAAWLWAWVQYDYVSYETYYGVEQDSDGLNNFNSGTQGDVTYGAENKSDKEIESANTY